MSKIERVPYPLCGTNDTVEMMTECAFARFKTGLDGVVIMKKQPEAHQGKISASKDRGLLSIMVGEKNVLVSARLDDVREIIRAADEANAEVAASENSGGEGADVPDTSTQQG